MIKIFETHELLGVVKTLHDPVLYWLNLLFPRALNSNAEHIDFDTVSKGRRLAPFVAPNIQGRVMRHEGYNTKKFKPAYVKPKDVVDPNRVLKRLAGEAIGGTLTPHQRHAAIVADILNDHKNMHKRRQEWMAAQAVINGSVVVKGEDYPEVTVDFGRHADQSKTLTAARRWSLDTSTPLADLDEWLTETQQRSGFAPTRVTMGTLAWKYFIAHEDVKKALDTRRGSRSTMETAVGDGQPAQYKGTIGASLEVWVYSDVYEDDNGDLQNFLNPETIVLSSGGMEGVRCFGAIMDAKAGWQSMEMFAKMWENEDPSVIYLLTQSAPLMVPTRPDAIMVVKVNG